MIFRKLTDIPSIWPLAILLLMAACSERSPKDSKSAQQPAEEGLELDPVHEQGDLIQNYLDLPGTTDFMASLFNKTWELGEPSPNRFGINRECDCCTDVLVFFRDSSFIQRMPCSPEVSYIWGKFSVSDNRLQLKYHSEGVNYMVDDMFSNMKGERFELEKTHDTLIARTTGPELLFTTADARIMRALSYMSYPELLNIFRNDQYLRSYLPKNETLDTVCDCQGYVDFSSGERMSLLDEPDGKVMQVMHNDTANQRYLHVKFYGIRDGHLRTSMMLMGDSIWYNGWSAKTPLFQTSDRNYIQGDSLLLYEEPDLTSAVADTVTGYNAQSYSILSCYRGWVLVQLEKSNKVYRGWMHPDMQCGSPYTTCN